MMKVKKRNMTELVLHGALLVLLFIPGMYMEGYWQVNDGHGMWTEKWTVAVSFWGKNCYQSYITTFLLWLLIIAVCVAFVLCLMQFLGRGEKSNLKICLPFPFVELALFLIPTFLTHTSRGSYGNYTSYYRYSPYALFPIGLALLTALILLTLIGYTRASKRGIIDSEPPTDSPQVVTRSTADELQKYKDLLDAGAITQEEFDQIKTQMLDL